MTACRSGPVTKSATWIRARKPHTAERFRTSRWRWVAGFSKRCYHRRRSGDDWGIEMQLYEALRFSRGWSVAFTGAGGKSTAMARLAAELSADAPVVVTSTTMLALHQADMATHHMVLRRGSDLLPLSGILQGNESVLVTGPAAESEPKWLGLGPEMVVALRRLADKTQATLLIEADGARGR